MTADSVTADHYGVHSSPDLFVLTPDGTIVNRVTRYVAPDTLAEFLKAGLAAPENEVVGRPSVPWAKSFVDAERLAKTSGKPIFVYVWNYG